MKRLLDSSSNARAVALLEAGLADAPSADAASRVALSLGVAGAVKTASAAGSASVAAHAPVALGGGKSVAASLIGKWLLIGAAFGAATSGGLVALQPSTVSHVAPPARDDIGSRAPVPARAVADRAPAAPERVPERVQPRRPEAPAARAFSDVSGVQAVATPRAPEPAARADGTQPLPAEPSALGADVAMIDAARRAVGAGDFRRALAALDAYDQKKRTQVLDREARLLRIDSLVLAGNRREALRLASDYLRSFPDDPHVARLRSLVGGGER